MDSLKKNVIVFFGGKSPEHEVSVITGVQVLNKLDKEKYNVIPIYVSKNGNWYYSEKFFNIEIFKELGYIELIAREMYLPANPEKNFICSKKHGLFDRQLKFRIDVIFPCFHGGLGENGAFQGLFEISEKPYVGTEILSSALGMDKIASKNIFQSNNIPTSPFIFFYKKDINANPDEVVNQIEKNFEYPVFIKPAVGGSSIGVTKASNRGELKNGLELASVFDLRIIVEAAVEKAREINVSVMGNSGSELEVSFCEEVFHSGDFLTYDDKYKGNKGKSKGMASTNRQIPAKISNEATRLVKDTAKKVFTSLNCSGLIRIDFLIKESPLEIFVLEVNTIPGSLAFYLWEPTGINFKDLCTNLIDLAILRNENKKKNITIFGTNILKTAGSGIKSSKIK